MPKILIPPNFSNLGFSAPNFAFLDEDYLIRRKCSLNFSTVQNLGGGAIACLISPRPRRAIASYLTRLATAALNNVWSRRCIRRRA